MKRAHQSDFDELCARYERLLELERFLELGERCLLRDPELRRAYAPTIWQMLAHVRSELEVMLRRLKPMRDEGPYRTRLKPYSPRL